MCQCILCVSDNMCQSLSKSLSDYTTLHYHCLVHDGSPHFSNGVVPFVQCKGIVICVWLCVLKYVTVAIVLKLDVYLYCIVISLIDTVSRPIARWRALSGSPSATPARINIHAYNGWHTKRFKFKSFNCHWWIRYIKYRAPSYHLNEKYFVYCIPSGDMI